MSYTKITQADLTGKGVIGLPDTPNLSTTDIQEKFDEIALDVIVPKFNDLSDELDASDIDSAIKSADITDMRLNADMAIEVSDDHGSTWSGTASSGHRIMDGSGTIYTQESKLQFSNNVTIQDDSVNGITKVLIQPGEKGDPGKAATITIGDVTEGVTASVTNVGSQTDAIFDITLPKGDPGDAATIAVGTVTSGATASVINSGTSDAAVFNFVLPKGDQGDPGTGLTLLGTYATLADLQTAHPTGQRGNAYFVGDDTLGYVYLWDPDTSAWVNIGELKGPKGNTGATPSLSIGTVQTGSPSAVTITGTTDYPVLNFTLEQGDKGDTGSAGTIAVGTVTSGQTASVTNVGTSTAAVFDFVLPKGDKGDQGNPTTVNGKSGNNVTLYGSDIDLSSLDSTKVDAAIGDLQAPTFTEAVSRTNVASGDSYTTLWGKVKKWFSDINTDWNADIGEIKAFMRTTAPTGYLSCDGTTYNIGDYPLLEALFTADFGAVNYFGGDGATTWKVPDLRGEFLRGTGTNGHSGQGNGANVGTHQDGTKQPGVFGNEWNVVGCQDAGTNYDWESGFTLARTYTGRTGVDTAGFSFIARPTNTSVLYCIRAYH